METRVELLSFILVIMDTKFVVMGMFVLPLVVGLHIQNLHEGTKLNITEIVAQASFLTQEVAITSINVRNNILFGPCWLIINLSIVVTVVTVATVFFFSLFFITTFGLFVIVTVFLVAFSTVFWLFLFRLVTVAILHHAHVGA